MEKNTQIYWIIGLIILAVILLPKLNGGLFAVNYVSNEPETREELKAWGLELRQENGYPPEPFLLIPEKESQGTNG